MSKSWITDNKDASPANNIAFDEISAAKSLRYTKK